MRKYNCFNLRLFKTRHFKIPFFITVGKRKSFALRVTSFFILVCVFTVFTDTKIRPVIKETAGNVIKNHLETLLNNSVSEFFCEKDVSYENLVTLEKNADGNITALGTDTYYINSLKSQLSSVVDNYLSENEEVTVNIPFGTLIGSDILNGRGTDIKVKIHLYGFSVTDFKNTFESAGINQTQHSIYITAKLSSFSYVGAIKINVTAQTDILVAQTVIVGSVPQNYIKK